jgi:protein-S-isoprenylcysteine O-methyltransferase Ste14
VRAGLNDGGAARDELYTQAMTTATPPAISRVVLPPIWMLIALLVEVALARWLPLEHWLPFPLRLGGWAFVAAGVVLALWAHNLFTRSGTGLRPFSPSTHLVADGPYRFTRNPMYLGMTLVLVGTALIAGALSPFVVPPLFMIVITALFIRYEEQHLRAAFGADYDAFRRKTRRWL